MSEKEVGVKVTPFELQFEDPYLERTFMLISTGKYEKAEERLEETLDKDPKCALAHLGLLLIELKLRDITELSVVKEPFDDSDNYKFAIKFASDELREYLTSAALKAMERYEVAHAYIEAEDTEEETGDTEEETADTEEETADTAEEETAPTEDAPKADKPATAPEAKPKASKAPRAPRKPLSKKVKGIIIAATSLVLIVGIVLAIALTLPNPATDFEYTISGDEVRITKYVGTDTTVVIPRAIEDKPVTSIGNYAFRYCDSLSSVVIPESVVSIGDYAFGDCESLRSIVIPDSVTSIGWCAFDNCESLRSIVIPDSVTSIGSSAFYYCESLSSIVIPDSVTSIGSHAFQGCWSLSSIVIPDSVTSIGDYAFDACMSLTIYCEAEEKPSGWASGWNCDSRPVEWGYKG